MVVDDGMTRRIQAARQGDQVAFESLVRPLIGQAHRLAYGMLRDHHAAEDAVQEATLKAWRRFHQFREGSTIRPWYLAIVANECRSLLRHRWRRVLTMDELPEPGVLTEEATVSSLDLERALARLTFEHRVVLCLFYFLGLPQEEIAHTLGIRVGTVKSRVNRAIGSLRRHLAVPEEWTA
jgi:RNA polymerase sigma-70 factor (ECF subfamily)